MRKNTNVELDFDLTKNRIQDKIIMLILTCDMCTLHSLSNLSCAREACVRAKKNLLDNKFISQTKRKRLGYDSKITVISAKEKLCEALKENKISYTRNVGHSSMHSLNKKIVSAEITSNFLRMGSEIYLGEDNTKFLETNYYVSYKYLDEFLTGTKKRNYDVNSSRLLNGIYVTQNMVYPIMYVSDYSDSFYYRNKRSNIIQQSRIRKLPNDFTNIIYLMGKNKHEDMLAKFILNEEKRGTGYSKFYNFAFQKNDTYLIPAKYDGTYEITKFAVDEELNNSYRESISQALIQNGYHKFVTNYFKEKDLWFIYMPVIKVNEIKEIVTKIKNSKEDNIEIRLVTFKENIKLIKNYIEEVLVNKKRKTVHIKIMDDLNLIRERKSNLTESEYYMEPKQ